MKMAWTEEPIKITMNNGREIVGIIRYEATFPIFWELSKSKFADGVLHCGRGTRVDLPPNTIINVQQIVTIDLYPEFNKLLKTLNGAQTNEDWLKEKIQHLTDNIQNEKKDND